MSEKIDKPILNYLENLELAGITFIRGYIQFLFDGPVLNTYTLPLIRLENKTITSAEFGYSDTLYFLINKKVISAFEDEKEERIVIIFEGDIKLLVSLKPEYRICPEAAMLNVKEGRGWNVW